MEQRASIPAFGGWDDMAAAEGGAGPLPDYSLDFSKIRAARMHRRKAQSWSSGAVNSTGEEQQSTTAAGPRTANDADAGATDDSAAIRAPPNKEERSKFKGYFFGCMGRW